MQEERGLQEEEKFEGQYLGPGEFARWKGKGEPEREKREEGRERGQLVAFEI